MLNQTFMFSTKSIDLDYANTREDEVVFTAKTNGTPDGHVVV